jgi:putative ABC transport system permease protein
LKADFPEVEEAVRLDRWGSALIAAGSRRFIEEDNIVSVDGAFLSVFSFPLLQGDPTTALQEPYSVVLTERMARKYFGSAAPLGQTLSVDQTDYRVTGVLRDPPAASHLRFDFAVARSTRRAIRGEFIDEIERNWRAGTHTYVLLTGPPHPDALAREMTTFVAAQVQDPELSFSFDLQPLRSIYLASNLRFELGTGNPVQLYTLSALALVILLIAGVNFINLSTARSAHRAREVGIRKVAGAGRAQLVRQFLSESLLVTAVSLVAALGLIEACLPAFSARMEVPLALDYAGDPLLLPGLVGVTLVVGLLAGAYPAFYLSRFQPARVLKGRRSGTGRAPLRRALVLFQFALSTVLIAGTLIIRAQLNYVASTDPGFDRDHVLVLRSRDYETFPRQYDAFKEALLENPRVRHVTASTSLSVLGSQEPFQTDDVDPFPAEWIGVDYDFLETHGIRLAAGRTFSRDVPTDAREAFLLNESAARLLGLPDPLGYPLTYNRRTGTVIGVVEDFHTDSFHTPIAPVVLYLSRSPATSLPIPRSSERMDSS